MAALPTLQDIPESDCYYMYPLFCFNCTLTQVDLVREVIQPRYYIRCLILLRWIPSVENVAKMHFAIAISGMSSARAKIKAKRRPAGLLVDCKGMLFRHIHFHRV